MLSVVVPAYREGPTIYESLQTLVKSLDALHREYEVVVVSDGNTDGTFGEAARVQSNRVRVVHYEEQRGKGFALKYGFDNVRGADLVAFIDADMELHPDGIGRLVEMLEAAHADAVIGCKTHPDSMVSYPPFRRVQSHVFRGLVRALFRLDVTDTQTGLKVFRKPLLDEVMPLLQSTGFAFDLELLVYANDLGYTILEGPVDLDYRFASTTGIHAVVDVLRDVAQIARRRMRLRRNWSIATSELQGCGIAQRATARCRLPGLTRSPTATSVRCLTRTTPWWRDPSARRDDR